MWDRDLKKIHFGRKRKSTGYIYLPGSQYSEPRGYLKLKSYLQDAVINYSPKIGKYVNKLEFYNQCHPRRVKDTNTSNIEYYLCVRTVMNVTPVLKIERELWGANRILRKVNDGVYICSCSVRSE